MEDNKEESKYIDPTPYEDSKMVLFLYSLVIVCLICVALLLLNFFADSYEKFENAANFVTVFYFSIGLAVVCALAKITSSLHKLVTMMERSQTNKPAESDPLKDKDGNYKSVFEEENEKTR